MGQHRVDKMRKANTVRSTETRGRLTPCNPTGFVARSETAADSCLPALVCGHAGGFRTDGGPRFRQLGRQRLRVQQYPCDLRTDPFRDRLGATEHACRQLASAHVGVAHDRLPTLRTLARRSPFNERLPARNGGRVPIPGAWRDDRTTVAQRVRGGSVCPAPLARRIGGLGRGAEGRVERPVLHAHALGVRAVPCAILRTP